MMGLGRCREGGWRGRARRTRGDAVAGASVRCGMIEWW